MRARRPASLGSSTDGMLAKNIGRSATRPSAISRWAAAMSSSGGATMVVACERLEAEPVGQRSGRAGGRSGRARDDGVDLRLVAVVGRRAAATGRSAARPRPGVPAASSTNVARGSQAETTRGAVDHGAVGELDAPHALALAEDGGDARAGAHACRPRPRTRRARASGTAPLPPTGRPTVADVLHGVGRARRGPCRACTGRAPTRPGRPRPRAPSPRPRGRSPQHGGDAAPAPAQERGARRGPVGAATRRRTAPGVGVSLASSTTSSATGIAAAR